MSWRPKNWRKKLPKIKGHVGDWKLETYQEVGIARHAFEAGADAIIEALKDEIELRPLLTDDEITTLIVNMPEGGMISAPELTRYMLLHQIQKLIALLKGKMS